MPHSQLFREKSSIFYSCVEHSSEAIMLTDNKGELVYVNRAWRQIYGYTWDEAIGRSPRLLRSPHQDDAFYRRMWSEIGDPSKGYWRGELVNRAKDGTEVPVLLTITPYRESYDKSGPILGYMGMAINLTDRKKMEHQLLHSDRLASVGMLASGLAHEIGTPLGVIRGRAEYLGMFAKDNHTLKSGLDIIVNQIDRISKLIYSLLHIARIEKSDTARPVAVNESVGNILNLISQTASKRGISVINRIGPNTVVRAERDRLEQVILNLCINSIHAMETAVQSGRTSDHSLLIESIEEGNYWKVSITDTGCGISPQNSVKIFTPFFTTKDIGSGTGLGLAIAYQIVQSWGGHLDFESELNKGTTFTLTLPKA